MDSTGSGWAFISIEVTRPLFMRMTRSAIGASAALWVMMSAVMPSPRHVSCNSRRIYLPVL